LRDELKDDIRAETPASFELSIDYVATKIPRFAFEKFPQTRVAAFGRKPPFKKSAKLCGALPRRYG
jgi:carbamoylphosphate synthase large subunit